MGKFKIYSNRIVIQCDSGFYEVELYFDDKKLKKGRGYILGDYVYVYRGRLKDFEEYDMLTGIYVDNDGFKKFHHGKDIDSFHVDNIIDLDPVAIFEMIEKNKDDFLTETDIEMININSEIFTSAIKANDDFLKQAIKEAINRKSINLKAYKGKFKNEHSLNNMKSALSKNCKMTVPYFKDWCEILGLQCEITLRDNGKDPLAPLKGDIVIKLD